MAAGQWKVGDRVFSGRRLSGDVEDDVHVVTAIKPGEGGAPLEYVEEGRSRPVPGVYDLVRIVSVDDWTPEGPVRGAMSGGWTDCWTLRAAPPKGLLPTQAELAQRKKDHAPVEPNLRLRIAAERLFDRGFSSLAEYQERKAEALADFIVTVSGRCACGAAVPYQPGAERRVRHACTCGRSFTIGEP